MLPGITELCLFILKLTTNLRMVSPLTVTVLQKKKMKMKMAKILKTMRLTNYLMIKILVNFSRALQVTE